MFGKIIAFGVVFTLIIVVGSVRAVADEDRDRFFGLGGLGSFVVLATALPYVAGQTCVLCLAAGFWSVWAYLISG